MPRIGALRIGLILTFAASLAAVSLYGCSKKQPAQGEGGAVQLVGVPGTSGGVDPQFAATPTGGFGGGDFTEVVPPPPTSQDRYQAALLEALDHMAERRYPEALAALQNAQKIQDSEQVRQQIDRLKAVIAQQAAAAQTAQDIHTVLDQGKPEEAAQLATAGLQQFGDSDAADKLATLKREADALAATDAPERAARFAHFRQEGDAAVRDKNLRAAAIAYEEALQYGEDPDVRRQRDDLQGALARYDDNRRRAAELRRDPARLEDAIAALQEAARAWDTLQVRQEMDEYNFALQQRRDSLSVADFEVLGDVGIPMAGRAIADELLPAFKCRFDLVERGQLGKVIEELRLEQGELVSNPAGRQELGRLANVRYLVVGSVSLLGGLTANARLVDVRSGLVVQTAQVVAGSLQELTARLPTLARLLMMSDQEKLAYEQQVAQKVPLVQPIVVPASLPPAPPVLAPNQPPPPAIIAYTPRPPDLAGVVVADFERFPPPTASVAVVLDRPHPVKPRLLQLTLQLGDNLFARGRYQEAHRHFELALSLSPGHSEIAVRLDRCRPHLPAPPPPPPPVVVLTPAPAPPPVIVYAPPPRPRIAVFNFLVNADPSRAPPGFGDWAAQQIGSYFAPSYEIVDRGEVCWYMGRLGVTARDVLTDASARCWLGRALNVRFFVFGVVQQTASFNVSTHLVDVETGTKQGGGSIHVQDHQELKLRLGELAQQTLGDPAQKARQQQAAAESERQVNEARRLISAGQFAQAATVSREALKSQPNNVAVQALLAQAEQKERQTALEATRRQEAEKQKALAAAAQKRQQELTRQADAARLRAQQEAARLGETAKRQQEAKKQQAYEALVAQSRQARQQGDYARSAQLLEGAAALRPGDAAAKELASVRAQAEDAARRRAATELAQRQKEQQQQRDAELARAREQAAAERHRREAEDQARKKAQEQHDQAAYAGLLNQARQALAAGKYDNALTNLQTARNLNRTAEVEGLIAEAQQKKTLAETKVSQTRAAEQRQAEERAARARADAEARQKQAEKSKAEAAAEQARKADAERRRTEYTRQMNQGKSALVGRRYDEAINAFGQALKAMPGDPAAARGQREATAARDATKTPRPATKPAPVNPTSQAPESRPRPETPARPTTTPRGAVPTRPETPAQPSAPPRATSQPGAPGTNPQAKYSQQMQLGATLERQKKFADAARAYQEALRAAPGDAKAGTSLRNAQFAQHMAEGRRLSEVRRFADAAKEFEEALKVSPGNADATNALKRAREGKP